MSSNPRIDQLKQMLALEVRRSALQEETDSLVTQINALRKALLDNQRPAVTAPEVHSQTRRAPRKGARRGKVTAGILDALKAAGSQGITVADLASKLGANYKNIYVWLATTGKKFPIKKLAPATYTLGA